MASFRPRNLTEFFQILWRRKSLIVFITVVVLASAFIVVSRIPSAYDSRALLVVSGLQYDIQTSGSLIAAVTEQVTSRSNLESLIRRYKLYGYQPEMKIDPLIDGMRKQVKLETKYRADVTGFPESFAISYRNDDPATAKQVVADVVSLFDKANEVMAKHAVDEANALKSEIAEVEAQLSQAGRSRRYSAARSSAVSHTMGNLERLRAERNAISSSVETLSDKQYMLERQISDQRRLISQQQQIVKSAPPSEGRGNGAYAALLKRKVDLEAQAQSYSALYTDKNPKVVQTREQLAEVNQRIAQLNADGEQVRVLASSPEAQELRTMERELARLETELDVVRREIGRKSQAAAGLPAGAPSSIPLSLPGGGGSEAAGTDLEFDTLRGRYDALMDRENSIKKVLPSAGAVAPPLFQVVDQPNLPQSASVPNRRVLMLAALILALALAFTVAAALEFRRMYALYDHRDVDYYLGVPVLALIPETFTPAERFQSDRVARKRRITVLVLGVASVPALALLLNSLGLFQLLGSK
jgi:uncharacterized protein involved in exopolysaccharide biosynthesis